MRSRLQSRLAGMIGNFLEHYDNALFGLLAPFIAPLFFPKEDLVVALIWTYAMMPLGLISKPLGSLFFGWIGDRFGRREALSISLIGMACITIGIGSLPIYQDIGIAAPLLLASGRMLQSFFAAGESSGGAIFVLENTSMSKRGFVSSCYEASSIGGILLASGLIAIFSVQGSIEHTWRFFFWAGGTTAFFGVFLRQMAVDGSEYIKASDLSRRNVFFELRENIRPLISIVLASGFSYTTYFLAFTLMNGYIPLVTSLSHSDAAQANTFLLIVDMCLLPCFGYLASRFGKERMMMIGAFGAALLAVPLFALLEQGSFLVVIVVRLAIVLFGVAFAAPYYAWALDRVKPCHRYLILSFGSAIGSQLIGAPSSAVGLWLYQMFGWVWVPGIYLLLTGLLAGSTVYWHLQRAKQTV